jgi:hypothetical protein
LRGLQTWDQKILSGLAAVMARSRREVSLHHFSGVIWAELCCEELFEFATLR